MSGRNIKINRKTRGICLVVEIFLNYECDYCCFSHFVLKICFGKLQISFCPESGNLVKIHFIYGKLALKLLIPCGNSSVLPPVGSGSVDL